MLVEMHSHVIYGVDDGAQTDAEMQSMLKLAAENKVEHLICTSHITPGMREFPADLYLQHLEEGQRYCDAHGLGIKLHIGSEIMYTNAAVRLLQEGYVPSLDQTMTVLVEFMPDVTEKRIQEAAYELGNKGYNMILAHVERYPAIHELEQVQELRDEYGVGIQMNCRTVYHKQSFMAQRWVRKLLSNGLIDFVSSDAHNVTTRPCRLNKAYRFLEEHYCRDYADALCGENIARLLGL